MPWAWAWKAAQRGAVPTALHSSTLPCRSHASRWRVMTRVTSGHRKAAMAPGPSDCSTLRRWGGRPVEGGEANIQLKE